MVPKILKYAKSKSQNFKNEESLKYPNISIKKIEIQINKN